MLQRTSFFCPRDVQIPDGRQKAPAPERNPLLSGIFRLRPADVRCGQAAHESDGAVRYAGESLKANNHPARQHSQVSHNPVPAFLAPFTGGLHPGSSAAHKLPAFCRASAAHGLPASCRASTTRERFVRPSFTSQSCLRARRLRHCAGYYRQIFFLYSCARLPWAQSAAADR